MQDDFDADYPQLDIQILSIDKMNVNGAGAASYSVDKDLPMVADNSSDDIWNSWGGSWRDVVILDANNEIYSIYNLTTYNLGVTSNYDDLKQLFIDAASQ
jgi:hypothetical protein